mgnify:CR=1 FL=1
MAAINRSTDMTTGSIWKRMVSFAVPVFLGNLCQQLYNTVDSVIVGKFVGKQALAAVASSGNLIFMMTGFFMGLFIGAGIVIAQYFGAKNYEKVRAAVHTDFAFALCCGVLLTLLGVFFTPTILTWMRTPADVLDTSILYFRLYFLGSLATILYNAGMGILQAVGDSRSPLYYLVISSAVNVALDLLFVGAMDMGVAGAVADGLGVEGLPGGALGHRAGDDPGGTAPAVELDLHVGDGALAAVGHELLRDIELGVLLEDHEILPFGGVHPFDLCGFQVEDRALAHKNAGDGIEDLVPGTLALCVVVLDVGDIGVCPDVEGVDAVVLGVAVAAVVDAAARHNVHIAVFTDVEVIINQLLNTGLGDDDGNVALFALGPILDADVNAGFAVGLAGDLDVLRGLPAVAAGVLANVEGAYRLADQVRDFFQQLPIYLRFHHKACTSLFSTGQPPSVSVRIRGRISFGVPRWRRVPSPTTMTSSAKEIIRS